MLSLEDINPEEKTPPRFSTDPFPLPLTGLNIHQLPLESKSNCQKSLGQSSSPLLSLRACDGHSNMGSCSSVFRCFLKLGEWQLNLQGINESTIPKVLQYYSAATEHDRSWYKVRRAGPALAPDPQFSTQFESSHVPMVTARPLECLQSVRSPRNLDLPLGIVERLMEAVV